jgi:single stranded DNA-binding protein
MTEASVSLAGNLTDDPQVRYTESGIARAMFRVVVSGRRDQEASFFTVIVWRDQAEHAAESLAKGSRVVVVGRLQQRSWTAEDGSARSTAEVVTEELGQACGGRRRRRRRGIRTSSHLDQRCDERDAVKEEQHTGVPLRRARAVEGAGDFSLHPQGRLCGRPPPAAILGRQPPPGGRHPTPPG